MDNVTNIATRIPLARRATSLNRVEDSTYPVNCSELIGLRLESEMQNVVDHNGLPRCLHLLGALREIGRSPSPERTFMWMMYFSMRKAFTREFHEYAATRGWTDKQVEALVFEALHAIGIQLVDPEGLVLTNQIATTPDEVTP